MGKIQNREIHLKTYPEGTPQESDFATVDAPLPEPQAGELLVRNQYFSLDPYMRARMTGQETYVPPYTLDAPLDGPCVGYVEMSRSEHIKEGEYVAGGKGWREAFVTSPEQVERIQPAEGVPLQAFLGILGTTGFTAYTGLLHIGQLTGEETVFVSAGAGAVGSAACQIARLKGCRVAASTSSDEKARWLREDAGVNAAINYNNEQRLVDALNRECPEGVDLYFDNVGGRTLEAAIQNMNTYGRLVLCGMISQYNARRPPRAPANLMLAIVKRLRMQGFIVHDHMDLHPQFSAEMNSWISQNQITWQETVVEGIEQAPAAFIRLFTGEKTGKMLVRIAS